MKIWTEPKITCISKPVFFEHPDYKLPNDGDNVTRLGTFAAKGCYKSFGVNGRPCEENQRALIEHGHGSVLEHINFGFYIEGISRALTLEMNRHRHLAISQESTRYVNEENSGIVLEPYLAALYHRSDNGWVDDDEAILLQEHIASSQANIESYQGQVEILLDLNPLNLEGFHLLKWARGKARNVLPHNLETKVTYTGNLRAWRHFIESRSSRHAEPEIRRLASAMYDILLELAPLYFEDYEVEMFPTDGPKWYPMYPEFTTEYRKI